MPTENQSSHRMTTRELVTIAVLSSLGGVLSTFIGYLGNLVNVALGVPFGAGQFMAGLHVFWIVIIRALVHRHGAGTAGGLLKGTVEMLTGSTHGVVVVVASVVQGLVIDAVASVAERPGVDGISSRITWWLGAGVATASNVGVFQVFYYSGAPVIYLSIISGLAFCSGVIFAGYFAWETIEFLRDLGYLGPGVQSIRRPISVTGKATIARRNLPAVVLISFLLFGSVYYVAGVARLFNDPLSCEVVGLVEHPYVFRLSDFGSQMVTIEAQLVGQYVTLPPANYTGVLLSVVLGAASPTPDAKHLRVIARDGYVVSFVLGTVLTDDRMLLTEAPEGLWLIAARYDGSMWVRMVTQLEVY
ncbi:MAG: ECF transporter S component [Candidatus Thorarchaeota archaeon]